jgi:two-component system sensor histidine kinase YesM
MFKISFNDLPIRHKLVIHFLLISILPSIVLGILVHFTINQIITKQFDERTLQLIGKINKSLDTYMSEIQNITYYISFNPLVQEFLNSENLLENSQRYQGDQLFDEINFFLQGFTKLNPELAGILLVNSKNEYVSNEFKASSHQDFTKESWYREAVNNRGNFMVINHSNERNITNGVIDSNKQVVSVVRSILNPITQETSGVVLIELKLNVISETFEDIGLGQSGFLMLVDEMGMPIYAPENSTNIKFNAEWFSQHSSGYFYKQIGDQEYQIFHRKSSLTNWSTVGVFTSNDSVDELREIRFYLISFIYLVSCLGVTISYFLSYSLSRPIVELTKFMSKVERGQFAIHISEHRTDEIGMLSRGFNKMLAKIRNLISLVEMKERQKRESELRVLHANIKPHFLYNTLDTIQWLAKEKGASEVSSLVGALSHFFRITLSNGKEMISFSDEIEHVKSYLTIQKTRYSHKLQYKIDVEPELASCSLLKLILQPIVENAIYHGIKERRGMGHVLILAKKVNSYIMIQIVDDGIGIPENKLQQLQNQLHQMTDQFNQVHFEEFNDKSADLSNLVSNEKELNPMGYGLINVHARLLYAYGDTYGLSIESVLHQGTTVTITCPMIKNS